MKLSILAEKRFMGKILYITKNQGLKYKKDFEGNKYFYR